MIAHPIVLAVAATDLVTLLLLVSTSWTAVRVVSSFRRGSTHARQIALERSAEAASISGRLTLLLLLVSSVLALVAVASILPGVVPGAMCGTGVLQAMGAPGERALAFRALALVALGGWALVDGLDRKHPDGPLTVAAARAMLVALPLLFLAAFETARAMVGLETGQPVSCCAVVYDSARAGAAASQRGTLDWVLAVALGGGALAALGMAVRFLRRARASRLPPVLLAAGTAAFAVTAGLALRAQLAAYWYGVLEHDCLFCLFTARHGWVGYVMLGLFAVTVLEGLAAGLASLVGARVPVVAELARARVGRAGLRSAVAALIFTALAVGPAVAWRLRHGVWIDG